MPSHTNHRRRPAKMKMLFHPECPIVNWRDIDLLRSRPKNPKRRTRKRRAA